MCRAMHGARYSLLKPDDRGAAWKCGAADDDPLLRRNEHVRGCHVRRAVRKGSRRDGVSERNDLAVNEKVRDGANGRRSGRIGASELH